MLLLSERWKQLDLVGEKKNGIFYHCILTRSSGARIKCKIAKHFSFMKLVFWVIKRQREPEIVNQAVTTDYNKSTKIIFCT